jgi:hypothetical protein
VTVAITEEADPGTDVAEPPGKRSRRARIGSFAKHPLVLVVLGGVFSALLIPQITREWQDRQREQEIKQSLLEEISTSATTAVREGNSLVGACVEQGSEPVKDTKVVKVCAPLPPAESVRAAGGEAGEDIPEIYAVLRNAWLIQRATARSRIITYFPDLYSCWYSYERALTDYLGLVSQHPKTKRTRVGDLNEFVDADLADVYGKPYGREEEACAALEDLPEPVQIRFNQLKGGERVTRLRSNFKRRQGGIGWDALTYPTWHPRFKAEYAKLGELLEIAAERMVVTISNADAKGFSHGIDIPGI